MQDYEYIDSEMVLVFDGTEYDILFEYTNDYDRRVVVCTDNTFCENDLNVYSVYAENSTKHKGYEELDWWEDVEDPHELKKIQVILDTIIEMTNLYNT